MPGVRYTRWRIDLYVRTGFAYVIETFEGTTANGDNLAAGNRFVMGRSLKAAITDTWFAGLGGLSIIGRVNAHRQPCSYRVVLPSTQKGGFDAESAHILTLMGMFLPVSYLIRMPNRPRQPPKQLLMTRSVKRQRMRIMRSLQ